MDGDPIQINRRTYDQIAGRFAERTANMDRDLVAVITHMAETVRPGERLLDLGCGPGRDLAFFEARGLRCSGADLSSGMLAEARTRVRAGLCQVDMRSVSFASGSFSAVWCNAALLHIPRQQAPGVVDEIARVLVPGGRLGLILQKGSGEGFETHPAENATRFFARYAVEEVTKLLEGAGFRVEQKGEYEYFRQWLWFFAVRAG